MIIWGTKYVRKNQGWVADFCPMCRCIRGFRLVRIGLVNHINFIHFGQGQLVGHEILCESCGIPLSADINHYRTFSKDRSIDLKKLILETHQNVAERYAKRLAMENQIRTGQKVTMEERAALIQEPFVLVNALVEARAAKTHFDLKSGICFLIFSLAGLSWFLVTLFNQQPPGFLRTGLLSLTAFAAIGTIYFLATDVRRFVVNHVVPQLIGALKPLAPDSNELKAILQNLEAAGYKVGRRIKAEQLFKALKATA